MALNKPLDAITEMDLQALVDNGVPEGKSIDYKQNLPSNNRDDKKEFLADTSSFANASGGDLIFGIRENAGVAVELCGLQGIDPDAEVLRLENILRDSLAPRIPGVSMRPIPLAAPRVAIVVRIPRSWAQPHVVDFQGHWRFYSRNSAGKYPLDVGELRSAFTLSETTIERLRRFRSERLGSIIAGETPVALEKGAKLVLHIVPIGAFDPASRFDVASAANNSGRLEPIATGSGWNHRHNFDGFLTYTPYSKTATSRTYAQVFRNGSIEAVEAGLLSRGTEEGGYVPSIAFEEALIRALSRYLSLQKELGVTPPLLIMLSLLGVAGYIMAVNRMQFRDETFPIDRNDLILPEIMIEDVDTDPAAILKPAFDAIWSAAGWPYSLNYDKDGKWVAHT